MLEDLNKLKHIGMSFPCDSLQLVPFLKVVVGPGAAHRGSSPQCFKLTFCTIPFTLAINLYSLFELFHIVLVTFCMSRRNGTEQ